MKRIVSMLALVAVLVVPATAHAAGDKMGVYVAPKFAYGYAHWDSKTDWADGMHPGYSFNIGKDGDSVFGGALAVGYDFSPKFQVPIRAEIEYAAFSEGDTDKNWTAPGVGSVSAKQKLQLQTLFVNAYYDFRNSTSFTPYVGAGIGMAFVRAKAEIGGTALGYSASGSTGSKTSTNFAWNVSAGLAYDITDYLSVDLGYRFAGLGDAKTDWGSYDGQDVARGKADDIYMHQVLLGVRFTF